MDFYTLHLKELEIIRQIQSIRGNLLDNIMLCLNLLDTFPFYVLIVTLIWFSYNQKFGIRLILLYFITAFINQNAKELLGQPRPCQMDAAVCMIKARSFGIPSGAAQSAIVLFGYLSFHIKKTSFWIFSIFMILLISFSRIYLGLHFFTDILGGWTLGLIILCSYIYFQPKVELFIAKQSKLFLTIFVICLTSALSVLAFNRNSSLVAFSSCGVMIGLIYSKLLSEPKFFKQRIIRPIIVLLGIFILLITSIFLPEKDSDFNMILSRFCQFFSGLWISFGVNPVIRKIEKLWIKFR